MEGGGLAFGGKYVGARVRMGQARDGADAFTGNDAGHFAAASIQVDFIKCSQVADAPDRDIRIAADIYLGVSLYDYPAVFSCR